MNPEQELDKMFGTEEPKESSAETAQDCEEEDEDDEDGPDVVVETSAAEETTTSSDKPKSEAHNGSTTKKIRRGRRGSKKGNEKETGGKAESAEASELQQAVKSTPGTTATARPFTRRPPKVAMVEYAVEAVLSHPRAAEFVQRTGRVVNILEFKHSRVAAGKN